MQNKAFFSFQLCPIESTACYNINTGIRDLQYKKFHKELKLIYIFSITTYIETLDGLKVTMSGCSSKKSSLSENYPLICEEKQLPGFTKGAFCHCFEDYCNYNGSNSIHMISISLKIIMITILNCSN